MFATIPLHILIAAQAAPRTFIAPGARLPILACVRLTVPDGHPHTLRLEATDLDQYLIREFTLPEPAVYGSIAIPYREFSRFLPTGPHAHLHLDGPHAVLTDPAGATARFEMQDLSQFPDPPAIKPGPVRQLTTAFFHALRDCLPFVSTDQTRYVLNGVHTTPTQAVATDGRRLISIATAGTAVPVTWATHTCKSIIAAFPAGASYATTTDNWAVLTDSTAATTVIVRFIDGNYPNFRQVIPGHWNETVTFADPDKVHKFLARLPVTGKGPSSVALQWRNANSVRLHHPKGELITPAAISGYFEPIAFNPAFFAAAIKAVGPTIRLIDPMSPGVLTSPTACAVLMPMRVHADKPEDKPAATA